MRVLLIEDSVRLQRAVEHGLRQAGFAVDVVGEGNHGLVCASRAEHCVECARVAGWTLTLGLERREADRHPQRA